MATCPSDSKFALPRFMLTTTAGSTYYLLQNSMRSDIKEKKRKEKKRKEKKRKEKKRKEKKRKEKKRREEKRREGKGREIIQRRRRVWKLTLFC